jgi:chromosome segregation ATPase
MVEATSLSSADAKKLTALVQSTQDAEDSDVDAPAGTVYKSSSGGIVETLESMHEKASAQLEAARQTETESENAYQMLAQSLNDEIKYGNADLSKAKKNLAASGQSKSTAEGDLSMSSKDLGEDEKTLSTLHQDCMTGAESFEAETKSRGEELKALAEAKKVIQSTTSGAADLSYSFLQLEMSNGADLANFEAVRFVRDLAHKQNSPVLAQLAQKMATAMRSGGKGVFDKVTGLIRDMIERLEAEAEADANEKSYCDKEMAYAEGKIADREAIIEKLSSAIDSMTAKSSQLKSQVATLQKEQADLARAQAEMNKLRAEENAAYKANSAEMEKGIQGVQTALKILRDYYAQDGKDHAAAEGAGNGIIGLLEVVESDFTQGLAEMTANENTAARDYDVQTKENEITKTTKDQSIKYKTKEFKGLDKATAETNGDRATTQTELDSVNEYYKGLQSRCVAKAETYAERTSRRAAEIAGLKQALEILNGEAVLIQQTSKRTLRGNRKHA